MLRTIARKSPHQVIKVKGKTAKKKPPAPFTTSSLQQAAGSRLKWSPDQTMQIAQRLYESGHITYMRTDSVEMDAQFCDTVRDWLREKDPDNVPSKVASHRKSKTAQEAHEAIRPTDIRKASAVLKQKLDQPEFELYLLIWLRTVASQCKPAQIVKSVILTQSENLFWQVLGQVVVFAGYAKYWKDIAADSVLPELSQGQPLHLVEAKHEKKQTQPPPRYTEAKLVQVMEKRGIGRPSTFAPTIKTLKQRSYAEIQKRKLQATPLGLEVDTFLQKTLPELLEADFTAQMEGQLDAIAKGKENWERYIINWNEDYFAPALEKALQIVKTMPRTDTATQKGNSFSQGKESKIPCPQCEKKMREVPSKSKKLHKKYFLKCPDCQTVMFYNKWHKVWELPGEKRKDSSPSQPLKLTKHSCPICGEKLAQREYEKDGKKKRMLVCSSPQAKMDKKHQSVAYFESRNVFWSKIYGEIPIE